MFVRRFKMSDLFKKSSKFVWASWCEEDSLPLTDTQGDVTSTLLEAARCIKAEGSGVGVVSLEYLITVPEKNILVNPYTSQCFNLPHILTAGIECTLKDLTAFRMSPTISRVLLRARVNCCAGIFVIITCIRHPGKFQNFSYLSSMKPAPSAPSGSQRKGKVPSKRRGVSRRVRDNSTRRRSKGSNV